MSGWSAPALSAAAIRAGQDLDGTFGGLVVDGIALLAERAPQLDRLGKRALVSAGVLHLSGMKLEALDAVARSAGAGVLKRLQANTGEALDGADAANELRKDWADIADIAVMVGEKAFHVALMLLLAA